MAKGQPWGRKHTDTHRPLSPDILSNADEDFAAACVRVAVVLGSTLSEVVSLANLYIIIETTGPWCRMNI